MTTISKEAGSKEPSQEWKRKLLLCEHSPIRRGEISWKWEAIPYAISTHFVRHHIGCEKFVATEREDRTGVPREERSQMNPVMMEMDANIQSLINISRKRLCTCADPTTRKYWQAVLEAVKEYDEDMVYSFFFKMYKLHRFYRENYNVNLDLPLLMSTLNLESSDPYEVFYSNITNEEFQFDYYYDWTTSDYKLTIDESQHDMELLAQNMVSKQVKEKCINSAGNMTNYNILRDSEIGTVTLICEEGETYQTEDLGFVLDEDKYDDFLKEFLEK